MAAAGAVDKVRVVEQGMEKKDAADAAAQAAEHAREDKPGETAGRKPYKSPTISRHGNLRLMTQLE